MNAWQLAWFIGVYLAVIACFVAIVRIGIRDGWWMGFLQLVVFVGFAVLFWAIESFANIMAPFYDYAQNIFPDMIPHLSFSSVGASDAAVIHPCVREPTDKISATVPLAAAVITFCLMWTSRQLLHQLWGHPLQPILVPFMVGLVALFLDLYLDPILAASYSCEGQLTHPGLGYWNWYTNPSLADAWFHVPIFNFAVWYSAPAILVSLVVLLFGILNFTGAQGVLLRALVTGLFVVILLTSPGAEPPWIQINVVLSLIVISTYFIFRNWSSYRRNNPFRWELILPLMFFFLYPLAVLLFASAVPLSMSLLLPALIFAAIGIFYTFSPYTRWPI